MEAAFELEERVEDFTNALVARDLEAVRGLVAELRAQDVAAQTLYTELFAPALHRVGELWAQGAISIAEEHVASSLIEQQMAALYPESFIAARASRQRVLVASPEGERHVIGLRMVSDILEAQGFDVVFLGADTPRDEFAQALRRYSPEVVVLAAYTAQTATALAETADLLHKLSPRLFIVAGGAADPIRHVLQQSERTALVENMAEALPVVEQAVAPAQRSAG